MAETGEEGVAREVKEETGMTVTQAEYLFSQPNIYLFGTSGTYAGYVFPLYGNRYSAFRSNGRCGGSFLSSAQDVNPDDFGLASIRKVSLQMFHRPAYLKSQITGTFSSNQKPVFLYKHPFYNRRDLKT